MSNKLVALFLVALFAFGISGCSKTAKSQAKNNQDLSGNRGSLIGEATTESESYNNSMVSSNDEFESSDEMVKSIKSKKAKRSTTGDLSDSDNLSASIDGYDTYTVKKNDTLQKISMHFYGTTKNWMKIYNVNKDKLKTPDKIIPGVEIKIPKYNTTKKSTT